MEHENSTLAARLLEIQEYQTVNDKSASWVDNLLCLSLKSRRNRVLQLHERPRGPAHCRRYIAVSYPWGPAPGLECGRNGGYSIERRLEGSSGRNQVRDEVIHRVIKTDGEKLQTAMDSMDLVYRYSEFSVGLIAVILKSQNEVDTLQHLLHGKYTVQRGQSHFPQLSRTGQRGNHLKVYRLLQRLYKDQWWGRAWIFQEEYLSSTTMDLLIRLAPGLATRREFGHISGEICIGAAQFREQATLFLLAYRHTTSNALQKRNCAKMLKRFGKYSVQFQFQHDARRKPMSPRIFADITRRSVKHPFDLLPITANSCDYAVRFNAREMSQSKFGVELCLLAMFLLNGELLCDSRHVHKLPESQEMHLGNYLQHIAFNKFDPPVDIKHLSYLKNCRLHQVRFCPKGRMTEGYIWKIDSVLNTDCWPYPMRWSQKKRGEGLDRSQRDNLHLLTCMLRRNHKRYGALAANIEAFLFQDTICTDSSPVKEHMELMAQSVVNAMRNGKRLYVAALNGSSEPAGIFVGPQDVSLAIFTSWHAGQCHDNRYRLNHVSLGVRVEKNGKIPLLNTVEWVNGLTFFRRQSNVSVIFKWPEGWMA
ncbi:hypothetical protein BST61_g11448 [Cercospora zeina]